MFNLLCNFGFVIGVFVMGVVFFFGLVLNDIVMVFFEFIVSGMWFMFVVVVVLVVFVFIIVVGVYYCVL